MLADFTEDLRVLARDCFRLLFVSGDILLPTLTPPDFPLRVRRLLCRDKLPNATEAVLTDKPCPVVTGRASVTKRGRFVGEFHDRGRPDLTVNRGKKRTEKVARECLSKGPLIVRAIPRDVELVESWFARKRESW